MDTPFTDPLKQRVPAAAMIRPQDVAAMARPLLHLSATCVVPELVLEMAGAMTRPSRPPAAAGSAGGRLEELVGATRTGQGRCRASVPPDWRGSGARARTIEVAFAGKATADPPDFEAAPVRLGRGFRVVGVRALQHDQCVLTASVSFSATPDRPDSPQLQALTPPQVPAASGCEPSSLPAKLTPIGAHLEIRPAAGPLPLSGATAA